MRRFRPRWVWIGAVVVVAVAVILAALPEVVRRVAVRQIREATGREVTIGDVDLNVFTGTLAVKAFRLADRGGPEPFVQFDRLTARLRLLPLFVGRVRLAELSLDRPSIRVVRTGPATFNFSDLVAPTTAPEAPRRRVALTVDRFRLVDGALIAHDEAITPPRTWKVDQLSVEARDLSTRPVGDGGAVTVAFKLGDTPISMKAAAVRLVPTGARAALTVGGFDLGLLLPYLPADAPASLKSGRFSATLALEYGGGRARVDGEARFDQLVLIRHGQAAPFASLPALTLTMKGADFADGGLKVGRIELAGDASVLDESVSPPARLDLTGLRVALEGAAWPARGPVSVQITAGLLRGGRLDARGTVGLAPVSANLRVVLGGVDLVPFQPYLPIAGRIGGRADSDLAVVLSVERGLAVSARGKAGVSRLSLASGAQPALEVERVDATGLDVAWPSRVSVARVLIRRPAAVIERDERGEFTLRSLLAPRAAQKPGEASARAPGPAQRPGEAPARAPGPAQRPGEASARVPGPAQRPGEASARVPGPAQQTAIEIGEVILEEGSARFVDRTLTPPYSEEISRLAVALKGLSNAEGKRAKLLAQGIIGGGSALELRGEVAPLGETLFVDLDGELRDFTIPRVNPFLGRILAWIARDGRITTKVHYRIEGDRLTATNEIVIGRLELAQAGEGDEVKRRVGMPLGLIVALIKDTRGEIRLSVPVSGRLGAPDFSFGEAIWTAVRNILVNIISAPFKLIGSLFTKDERIEAAAIDPVRFEAGSAAVSPAMAEHLQKVGDFLRASPFVRLMLAPVVTGADLTSLKTQEVTARIQRLQREARIEFSAAAVRLFTERFPGHPVPKTPEEIVAALRDGAPDPDAAARALAERRVLATREALVSRAGVPAERLPARDTPAPIGAPGEGRVEFTITQ